MNCFICKSGVMQLFFCKKRNDVTEQFYKCNKCGLVINKTLYAVEIDKWKDINYKFHKKYQGTEQNEDDPRWVQRLKAQAQMICDLYKCGIISYTDRVIDYGCGDGKLSDFVNDIMNTGQSKDEEKTLLAKYDKYMGGRQGLFNRSRYYSW